MTIEEYIAKQRRLLQQLATVNMPLQIAARSTMAMQANRIFVKGEKSDGSQIGQYDTTHPLYINPNKSPRKSPDKAKGIEGLSPIGKHGQTVFKNGKPHVTSYVKSYKELRNKIGRQTSHVDLVFSGDLQSDFRNAPIDSKEVNPKKISVNEYQTVLVRDENVDKIRGSERKYGGKITDLQKAEKDKFYEVLGFEYRKLMSQ